jgi:hypothetical protein
LIRVGVVLWPHVVSRAWAQRKLLRVATVAVLLSHVCRSSLVANQLHFTTDAVASDCVFYVSGKWTDPLSI